MLKNYLRIAWRQLIKDKTYSLIKICGLSVSIAFCLLVILFIKNQFSFDGFHNESDRIFRVEAAINLELAKSRGSHVRLFNNYEEVSKSARISPGIGPALMEEIPDIIDQTRYNFSECLVKKDGSLFQQPVHYVDENFFSFFSFSLIKGNNYSILNDKSNCIITLEAAEKFFGDSDPIGKTIEIKLQEEFKVFTVAGIADNAPDNSSISFSVLVPIINYVKLYKETQNWESLTTSTFIKLRRNYNLHDLEENLYLFSRRKFEGVFANGSFDETADPADMTINIELTNLKDIYLKPFIISNEDSANPVNAYILGGLALLIIIVACTNYISIALASSANRSTEVGIRKVLGAKRNEIFFQFLSEALLFSVISTVSGLLLAEALMPVFISLTGGSLNIALSGSLTIIAVSVILALIIGVTAGLYPAFIMSRYKSALVINKSHAARFKARFTSILVGFQFAISCFLITSAVIMSRQMSFINDKNIGYDPSNIMVLDLYGSEISGNQIVDRLKHEFSGSREIIDIAGTSLSFGRGMSMTMLNVEGQSIWVYDYDIDYNLIPMMKIDLLKGRNFDGVIDYNNEQAVIINEVLAKKVGIKKAGAMLSSIVEDRKPYEVIGIAADINFQSLLHEVNPMIFSLGITDGTFKYALLKIEENYEEAAIRKLSDAWLEIATDIPFKYSFMEANIKTQYQRVTHWQDVVNASTLFAVFIALLGLFGITGLQAVNKTKEIGIRKVLGAGINDIIILINKRLFLTAFSAFIIALPVSIIVSQNWLDKFAYRINLSLSIFLVAAAISFSVGLITVAFHRIRAAITNPVETLKVE